MPVGDTPISSSGNPGEKHKTLEAVNHPRLRVGAGGSGVHGAAIVANMEEVGLHPKLVVTDVSAMINDIFSEDGTGAVYHLSWRSNGDPFRNAFVYSDAFAWYFGDEHLQKLMDLSATTTEPAECEQVVQELQAYMWKQLWHVPPYNTDFTIASNTRLQNLDVTEPRNRFLPSEGRRVIETARKSDG